jgi:hypothetical protein
VSTRHAFALAFDLAVRRDPFHSLVVPLLLRAPWALALAMIPSPEEGASVSGALLVLGSVALVGDWITLLVVSAMLRFRARSVFNTPPGVRPMPVSDSYRQGLRRIPWLVVTETVRNVALALSASFSILPAVLVRLSATAFFHDLGRNLVLLVVAACLTLPFLLIAFRLAVATECVVLDEHDMAGAFVHSFRLMRGRSERWFELVAGSAAFIISVAMVYAFTTVMFPVLGGPAGVSVFWLLVIAVTPIIQYAWTFFYLRLIEVEAPVLQEIGPFYASAASPAGTPASPAAAAPESPAVRPATRPNGAPVATRPPGSGPVA